MEAPMGGAEQQLPVLLQRERGSKAMRHHPPREPYREGIRARLFVIQVLSSHFIVLCIQSINGCWRC